MCSGFLSIKKEESFCSTHVFILHQENNTQEKILKPKAAAGTYGGRMLAEFPLPRETLPLTAGRQEETAETRARRASGNFMSAQLRKIRYYVSLSDWCQALSRARTPRPVETRAKATSGVVQAEFTSLHAGADCSCHNQLRLFTSSAPLFVSFAPLYRSGFAQPSTTQLLTDSSLRRARPRSQPKPKSTAETSSPSPRHRSRYSPRHFVCLFIKIAVNLWSGPCVALYIFPSVRSSDSQANSHAWVSPSLSVQLITQEQKRPHAERNREPSVCPKSSFGPGICKTRYRSSAVLCSCPPFRLLIIPISAWKSSCSE